MFDYIVVGAGFSGAVTASQMARDSASGYVGGSAIPMSAVMRMTTGIKPEYWYTSMDLTSSIQSPKMYSIIFRSLPSGAITSIGCSRR